MKDMFRGVEVIYDTLKAAGITIDEGQNEAGHMVPGCRQERNLLAACGELISVTRRGAREIGKLRTRASPFMTSTACTFPRKKSKKTEKEILCHPPKRAVKALASFTIAFSGGLDQ